MEKLHFNIKFITFGWNQYFEDYFNLWTRSPLVFLYKVSTYVYTNEYETLHVLVFLRVEHTLQLVDFVK